MLDEARITRKLAARGIAPDARQRDAIAALVALLGTAIHATHATRSPLPRSRSKASIATGCLDAARVSSSIRHSNWRTAASGVCTSTNFCAR